MQNYIQVLAGNDVTLSAIAGENVKSVRYAWLNGESGWKEQRVCIFMFMHTLCFGLYKSIFCLFHLTAWLDVVFHCCDRDAAIPVFG